MHLEDKSTIARYTYKDMDLRDLISLPSIDMCLLFSEKLPIVSFHFYEVYVIKHLAHS